jgi:hypothetical protein
MGLACRLVEQPFEPGDASLTYGAFLIRLRELVGRRVEVVVTTQQGDVLAAFEGLLDEDLDVDVERHALGGSFAFPVRPDSGTRDTEPLWLFLDEETNSGSQEFQDGVRYLAGATQVLVRPKH